MKSTLFLRNITCIDHAFINKHGYIVGGSYHQDILVTGKVEENEQVVLDFSKVKKQLKDIIDDRQTGYDHKLWIVGNHSTCDLSFPNTQNVKITTLHGMVELPKNAIKYIYPNEFNENLTTTIEQDMNEWLTYKLNEVNGVEDVYKVEITLNEIPFSHNPTTFRYWHGLKNSSSWGCQNIAHGHLSFVECHDVNGSRCFSMERKIAEYLDTACLVYARNITDTPTTISYTTEDRGDFKLNYGGKIVYFSKETTIENIVDHVVEKFKEELEVFLIKKVFISEGLQKGALKLL